MQQIASWNERSLLLQKKKMACRDLQTFNVTQDEEMRDLVSKWPLIIQPHQHPQWTWKTTSRNVYSAQHIVAAKTCGPRRTAIRRRHLRKLALWTLSMRLPNLPRCVLLWSTPSDEVPLPSPVRIFRPNRKLKRKATAVTTEASHVCRHNMSPRRSCRDACAVCVSCAYVQHRGWIGYAIFGGSNVRVCDGRSGQLWNRWVHCDASSGLCADALPIWIPCIDGIPIPSCRDWTPPSRSQLLEKFLPWWELSAVHNPPSIPKNGLRRKQNHHFHLSEQISMFLNEEIDPPRELNVCKIVQWFWSLNNVHEMSFSVLSCTYAWRMNCQNSFMSLYICLFLLLIVLFFLQQNTKPQSTTAVLSSCPCVCLHHTWCPWTCTTRQPFSVQTPKRVKPTHRMCTEWWIFAHVCCIQRDSKMKRWKDRNHENSETQHKNMTRNFFARHNLQICSLCVLPWGSDNTHTPPSHTRSKMRIWKNEDPPTLSLTYRNVGANIAHQTNNLHDNNENEDI